MLTYPQRRPVTWALWQYLNYPAAHPIFRQTLRSHVEDRQTTRSIRLILVFSTLGVCGALTSIVQAGSTVIVPLLVLVVMFSSGLPAAIWSMVISTRLAWERERRTYEPASLPPSGALGMNLATCAATLHRYDAFGWLNITHQVIVGMFGFVLLSLASITAFSVGETDIVIITRFLLDVFALLAAAYVDRVQSIVLACIVGMLTPVYTLKNVPIWGGLAFGSVQMTTLAAGGLAALWLGLPGGFLVFYLLREAGIAVLWWWLNRALNSNPLSLDVQLS